MLAALAPKGPGCLALPDHSWTCLEWHCMQCRCGGKPLSTMCPFWAEPPSCGTWLCLRALVENSKSQHNTLAEGYLFSIFYPWDCLEKTRKVRKFLLSYSEPISCTWKLVLFRLHDSLVCKQRATYLYARLCSDSSCVSAVCGDSMQAASTHGSSVGVRIRSRSYVRMCLDSHAAVPRQKSQGFCANP